MDRDQMDELLAPIGQLGAAMAALEVTDAAAEKALAEVLAIRLYTGPAYVPINAFLREVAKVS